MGLKKDADLMFDKDPFVYLGEEAPVVRKRVYVKRTPFGEEDDEEIQVNEVIEENEIEK